MTIVFSSVCTNTYYTRHPDQGDSWDAGEQRVDLECVSITVGDWGYEPATTRERIVTKDTLEKGDNAYVVVVRYTTGSTFGFTHGIPCVLDVFHNLEDATGLCEAVESARKSGEYHASFNEKSYYCGEWTGYFESLDDIEIRQVVIS